MNTRDLINFETCSFRQMCEWITDERNFSLARYGDGEFNAILQHPGANCDNHPYSPEMGRMLAEILASDPPYFTALHQNKHIQGETIDWLIKAGLIWRGHHAGGVTTNYRTFAANAVFHDALAGKEVIRDGEGWKTVQHGKCLIDDMWKALQWREVFIIAPQYIAAQTVIPQATHISIPAQNTFHHLDDVIHDLSCFDMWDAVVLVCASMTAPIIVHRLYDAYRENVTAIDFGCVFDYILDGSPYTRTFFNRIEHRNLEKHGSP